MGNAIHSRLQGLRWQACCGKRGSSTAESPNHQTGRNTPRSYRQVTAYCHRMVSDGQGYLVGKAAASTQRAPVINQ